MSKCSGRSARLGCLAMVAALSLAIAPARAEACASEEGEFVGIGTALLLIPSEIGTLVTAGSLRFVLGWSGQYPFPNHERHRVILGMNWIPGDPDKIEGRLGYRYAPGRMFGGLGVALDGETDDVVALNAFLAQGVCEAVGFRIELTVGQPLLARYHGFRVRRLPNPSLK